MSVTERSWDAWTAFNFSGCDEREGGDRMRVRCCEGGANGAT